MKPRRRTTPRKRINPDWHALAASAKDKARRAHEWSKPHARKAWEATKAGAKRGSKKAAGSLAERLQRYSVANPERPAPMGLSAAEIRRHVAGEAKTAKGHHSLALAHYRESEHANLMRDYTLADYHGRMAHEHELRARALDKGKRPNPDISDAEIRRRVASEASSMREHRAMATAHREAASRAWQARNRWMADYYTRMADAHDSMARSLASVASSRRR